MDGAIDLAPPTTLDEPVLTTITRDLSSVASKLRVVLRPSAFVGGSQSIEDSGVLQALKDWDLWGPLLICLSLSCSLSINAGSQGPTVFSAGRNRTTCPLDGHTSANRLPASPHPRLHAVFVLVWAGAAIVTLNAQVRKESPHAAPTSPAL